METTNESGGTDASKAKETAVSLRPRKFHQQVPSELNRNTIAVDLSSNRNLAGKFSSETVIERV